MKDLHRHTWKGVRAILHGRVLDGTYGPGSKLPRDEDLAAELGCARATVQRAMRNLAEKGIVERRRKGGTRVRLEPVTRATLDIPIIRKEVEALSGAYGYELIRSEMAETPAQVVENFGMRCAARMLRVEALHLRDGNPFIYEERWVCTETVPEIQGVDLAKENANEWLVRNRPYSHGQLRFYAIQAGERFARVLRARENDALFVLERTTWIGEKPITSVKAVAAPGYQLRSEI